MDSKHEWTGMQCLVNHADADGNYRPPCKECRYCGLVEYPYTQPCKKRNDLTPREREQKLVDICFQVAMFVQDKRFNFHKMSQEELAEWVAKQLRECGFPTRPMGCSWGVLI